MSVVRKEGKKKKKLTRAFKEELRLEIGCGVDPVPAQRRAKKVRKGGREEGRKEGSVQQ